MSGDKRLLELAQKLHAIHRNQAHELPAALVELASVAASAIPGAAYAGITLLTNDGAVETPAASYEYAALLDDIQQKHHEGPCLHAARHGEAVLVTNIATDDRWPRYRQEALTSTPVRSVLSLPMLSDTGRLGALNAFGRKGRSFRRYVRPWRRSTPRLARWRGEALCCNGR